ncbi:hypothetical protein BDZ89DRAFT_177571 [Hymenopellis radicata]|nr:hypothetical protein BDZ89DRAFT_177571 [Hymenopellis radicata]
MNTSRRIMVFGSSSVLIIAAIYNVPCNGEIPRPYTLVPFLDHILAFVERRLLCVQQTLQSLFHPAAARAGFCNSSFLTVFDLVVRIKI